MPQLIRLYIRQAAIGFLLSAVFVAALLWFDVARLWHLVRSSDMGPVAVAMLWAFHGIVFAAVQFAIRIMTMADPPDDGGRRDAAGVADRVPEAVAVPVPAAVRPPLRRG
ncbi:MAG: hypothetical protein IT542_04725 [Rubellimicrobium sp.]|nr:hypothetical protein [Rubellimicrobium sp.]